MEIHKVSQLVAAVVAVDVAMAANWAVREVFIGVCLSNRCIKVAAYDWVAPVGHFLMTLSSSASVASYSSFL